MCVCTECVVSLWRPGIYIRSLITARISVQSTVPVEIASVFNLPITVVYDTWFRSQLLSALSILQPLSAPTSLPQHTDCRWDSAVSSHSNRDGQLVKKMFQGQQMQVQMRSRV